MMRGKKILLGVTGGIAAYKSCYLARELMRMGAEVRVVMTPAAAKFVTPLTFSALTGNETLVDLWKDNQAGSELRTTHISNARWADVIVIAPASANTLAKITYGLADNLLTVLVLAAPCPIILAPAMDTDMFSNSITQENLSRLKSRGFYVLPPEEGDLASGLKGPGRLPEVDTIIAFIESVISNLKKDLEGKHILVSAGPTYEAIDPVRFIGNRSSGKMGFAVAQSAAMRGAEVTLVSGPVNLDTPRNVNRVDVVSAADMLKALKDSFPKCDALIMAAAVADFTPAISETSKIKKDTSKKPISLELKPTTDILEELSKKKKRQVVVGFALETDNELKNAKQKLARKNLDIIVLNSLRDEGAGFGKDTNVVTIIDKKGKVEKLPKMSKLDVGNAVLDKVVKLFNR